jgi:hypothetical protein
LIFTGLHGIISHETDLFIATAVRASTPTMKWLSIETVVKDRNCQINPVEFTTGVPLVLDV